MNMWRYYPYPSYVNPHLGPDDRIPDPLSEVVALIKTGLVLQELGRAAGNSKLAEQGKATVIAMIEGWCGSEPWHIPPIRKPGPPNPPDPPPIDLALQLMFEAQEMQAGYLQDELTKTAAGIIQQSVIAE